jgi:hypothetical protein
MQHTALKLDLDLLSLACSSISFKSRRLFTKNSSWQTKQSIPDDQMAAPVPEIINIHLIWGYISANKMVSNAFMKPLHRNAAAVTVQALFHYVNA